MSDRNRQKKLFLNIFLLVVTVGVIFFLAEVGYRIYEIIRLPATPAEGEEVVWSCYHEVLGWTHIPGVSIKKVNIDRHGYRVGYEEEKEHALPEKIIAAFGDSFTFGDDLQGEDTWSYQLGQKTEKRGFGVVNLGVCAYGIDQMYLLYREEEKKLDPSVVLAAIISWDIQRVIKSQWKGGGRHKPRFVFKEGTIELGHVPVPLEIERDRRLTRWHDILFDVKRVYLLDRFWSPEDRLWQSMPDIPPSVYEAERIPPNKHAEGVLISQKIIERWRAEVEGAGRRFILVLIPLKKRIQYYHSYLITLRDNLARQGVEIVDCQKAFQQAAGEGKKLFRGSHPSPAGQQVIANQVYYYLVRTGAI